MNLLLDTHIWLWSHAEPERLTKRVAATADVYELTLVTGDDRVLRGKGFRTLANR